MQTIKIQHFTRNVIAQWCPFLMTDEDRIDAGYGRSLIPLSQVDDVIRKWRAVNPTR